MGLSKEPDPQQPAEVQRWRKLERQRLIKDRLALPSKIRRQYGERIAEQLEQATGDVAGLAVSAYWPFRGEPDLRCLLVRLAERRPYGAARRHRPRSTSCISPLGTRRAAGARRVEHSGTAR